MSNSQSDRGMSKTAITCGHLADAVARAEVIYQGVTAFRPC